MPEVTFSAHQLILDEDRCSFEDLKGFFSKGDDTYTDTENFYQISREIIDDRFLWLSYWFKAVINETLIQNLGTLFSILFGFYIAALSVLYGSAYSKRLYKKIDAEIPTQTQLHTLRRYFSASSTWAIRGAGCNRRCFV